MLAVMGLILAGTLVGCGLINTAKKVEDTQQTQTANQNTETPVESENSEEAEGESQGEAELPDEPIKVDVELSEYASMYKETLLLK